MAPRADDARLPSPSGESPDGVKHRVPTGTIKGVIPWRRSCASLSWQAPHTSVTRSSLP